MPENESFVRWQDRLIGQLGFVNNLIIGIDAAFLAYFFQLDFQGIGLGSPLRKGIMISLVTILFISLLIGLLLAWNRLGSFRYTARIARKRETGNREGIDELRQITEKKDDKTWDLLKLQIASFSLGITFLFGFMVFQIAK